MACSSNLKGLKNDFVRNILWTFEDIHMLVGSNMPIFGGGRYPAVSLRLRWIKWIKLDSSLLKNATVVFYLLLLKSHFKNEFLIQYELSLSSSNGWGAFKKSNLWYVLPIWQRKVPVQYR